MLTRLFKNFAHVDNLTLAFRRLKFSAALDYKSYYDNNLVSFQANLPQNIKLLSKEILTGYQPSDSFKVFQIKSSGIQRPITVLGIRDLIVYQAIANIIADRVRNKLKKHYHSKTFGNILNNEGSWNFFDKWNTGYDSFNEEQVNNWKAGKQWFAEFDLTAFYDSIGHDVLRQVLENEFCFKDEDVLGLLIRCLTLWTKTDAKYSHDHGIPQGPEASSLFAECVLSYFDKYFALKEVKYLRYVDDIRLQASSEYLLRRGLVKLDYLAKDIGVFPQSQKINVIKITKSGYFKKIALSNIPVAEARMLNKTNKTFKRIKRKFYSSINTKKNEINNTTTFKFTLNRLPPSDEVMIICLKLFPKYPSLSYPFWAHLSQYEKRIKVINFCIKQLKMNPIYDYMNARLWDIINSICSNIQRDKYAKEARISLVRAKRMNWYDSYNSLIIFLSSTDYNKKLFLYYKKENNSFIRKTFLLSITQHLPEFQRNEIVNMEICSKNADIALLAATIMVLENIKKVVATKDVNQYAQNVLKRFGVIKQIKSTLTTVSVIMRERYSQNQSYNWEKIYGKRATFRLSQLISFADSYYDTDYSAWVACMNSFTQYLLKILHEKKIINVDPKKIKLGAKIQEIGKYIYNSDLKINLPNTYKAFLMLNESRKHVPHTHPLALSSKKIVNAKKVTKRERNHLTNNLKVSFAEIIKMVN